MKITKQISERKFEVELEDLDFSREKRIIVAHDYVRFMGNSGMQTISSSNVPLHTVNTCANWIPMMQEVTIPIRERWLSLFCRFSIPMNIAMRII